MSDIFNFKGPNTEYVPVIDNAQKPPKRPTPKASAGGYYNLEELTAALKKVKDESSLTFDICSKQLADYSIKVDTANTPLMEAHDLVYPSDTTPGYITFDEYKYLMTATDSNEIQYLKKYYEKEMRNVSGTVALDCLILCRAIHLEVERITNFINKYIGELDETAEFRVVELFQDWTETALSTLQRLKAAVQTPITQGIPRSELARLTPELSASGQALLQIKLNKLNQLMSDFMEMFEKTWNSTSDHFYDRVLGPQLLFQVKFGKTLTDPNNVDPVSYPTLVGELQGAISGISKEFSTALTDQLKRNQIFTQYIRGVLENYPQREYYKNAISQLGNKGKTPVNNFVPSSAIDQASDVLNASDPLTTPTSSLTSSTGLRPSHNDLVDRDSAGAHDQYLLRNNGEVTGPITFKDGATIDGIVPSEHKHTGLDGSAKIHGSSIEYGTITDDEVSVDPSTAVPQNLRVSSINDALATRVTVEIQFDVGDSANIVNYEFEYVKIS